MLNLEFLACIIKTRRATISRFWKKGKEEDFTLVQRWWQRRVESKNTKVVLGELKTKNSTQVQGLCTLNTGLKTSWDHYNGLLCHCHPALVNLCQGCTHTVHTNIQFAFLLLPLLHTHKHHQSHSSKMKMHRYTHASHLHLLKNTVTSKLHVCTLTRFTQWC